MIYFKQHKAAPWEAAIEKRIAFFNCKLDFKF